MPTAHDGQAAAAFFSAAKPLAWDSLLVEVAQPWQAGPTPDKQAGRKAPEAGGGAITGLARPWIAASDMARFRRLSQDTYRLDFFGNVVRCVAENVVQWIQDPGSPLFMHCGSCTNCCSDSGRILTNYLTAGCSDTGLILTVSLMDPAEGIPECICHPPQCLHA